MSRKRGRKSKVVEDLDHLISLGSGTSSTVTNPERPVMIEDHSSKRPRLDENKISVNYLEDLVMELGLNVFLVVYQAVAHVPQSLLLHRNKMICNIVNHADVTVAEEKLTKIVECLDASPLTRSMPDAGKPPLNVLWRATHATRMSHLHFLTPPSMTCLKCHSKLKCNNKPTQVVFYTERGPIPATKIILQCTNCNLNYHPDVFGNSVSGYDYYPEIQPIVRCTQEAYMERILQKMIVSAGHHAWTSFESWGEIYNEVFQGSQNTMEAKVFFSKNPIADTGDDDHLTCWKGYLTRKHVSEAFWNGEVENEWRDQKHVFSYTSKSDRELFMDMVDQKRAKNPYVHKNCSDECKKRGCGTLWSIDGNWKLAYPICMYEEPKNTFNKKLKYISCCPRQPVPRMDFCSEHCNAAEKLGIPSELKPYLQYRKNLKPTGNKENCVAVTNVDSSSITAADCQGVSTIINKHPQFPSVVDYTDEEEHSKTSCNKDTGTQKKLQKWTRGHLFIVRGGGHIETWQPLYQSEGPAQVFLIVLTWMAAVFGHLPRDEVKRKVISYDNMCHLNNLKVAKKPLPLPGNLQTLWLDVQKIIDSLHISNHKDVRCKEQYSPENFKDEYPDSNTMCCEQTFTWLSRYKRIVNAMPKTHHHFYLHRMVQYRNRYIEMCYKENRRPVLPSVKGPVNC